MIGLTLLLMQGAAEPEIVVRGRRTEAALEACVAGRCATPDDVRMAIAHAEALFAQGDYRGARAVLSAALSRQSGQARRYPRLIAALYEANATVNLHLGDMNRYRSAVGAQARTLRESLPANDPQVLMTAVMLGDFRLKQRQFQDARRQFEAAAAAYERAGEARLATLCALRVVSVDVTLRDFSAAARRLEAISRSAHASDPAVRLLSAVMMARLTSARGREVDMDALFAALRTDARRAPVLVRPGTMPRDARQAATMDQARLSGVQQADQPSASLQWADVGFMVARDGTVTDVDLLRSSRDGEWIAPHLVEIAGRRYAPIDLPAGHPGLYRVERYTRRNELAIPTGSFIRRPGGPRGVEMVDMTRQDPVPPSE